MRAVKCQWLLFVLSFLLVLPALAQEEEKEPEKRKEIVNRGRTLETWISFPKSKESNVRLLAVEAIGKIGPNAKKAVPALIEALKDESPACRKAAQTALKEIEKNGHINIDMSED